MTDAQFFNTFKFRLYQLEHNYSMQFSGRPHHSFGRIVSGEAKMCSAQNDLQLHEGDIFFIPKGLKYRSQWTARDGSIVFYSFSFSLFPLNTQSDFQLQKLDCTPEEIALFRDLEHDIKVSATSIGNLYRFLGQVIPKMEIAHKSKHDIMLETALAFMRSNQSYTIADVARHCNVSECSLFINFRKHLGKTPVEIRHQIISEKATTLLTTTDLSIEDISTSLGFSSSSYFRKILKATTGKTPTQIRHSQRHLL